MSVPDRLVARDRQSRMLRTAMGPQIAAALADPDVIEVMLNPCGALWVDRRGVGRVATGETIGEADAERIIRLVASHVRQECHAARPIVSAELPETGERFEGVLPPVVRRPAFAIRKPAGAIYTLEDYVRGGILSATNAVALDAAVAARANILIVGGTSTGKTTLANALLARIAATGDRVVIIEDTRELQCTARDQVALRTREGVVTMAELVRSTLRLRPDRIVVGEVRGREALDMLKAWNTGHPGGLCTIHANSALGGLVRLEQLVAEASASIPHALIAEAVDLLVFIAGRGARRRVEAVTRVAGHDGRSYRLHPIDHPEDPQETGP
jgi:type IV secretion system protein VirB11